MDSTDIPVIPAEYVNGWGPLYWQNEQSGTLVRAVHRFFRVHSETTPSTAEQLELCRRYVEYWVNAPCWEANPHLDEEGRAELARLRASIKSVTSERGLVDWLEEALKLEIDPF